MPALLRPEELQPAWTTPATLPLDEGVWKAWIAKGRERDRLKNIARVRVIRWIAVLGLIAAAALWRDIVPFELAARSALTVGALLAMFLAFREARFTFAGAFGVLALLFNPLARMLYFPSGWQRAIVAASALVLLLDGRKGSDNHNG